MVALLPSGRRAALFKSSYPQATAQNRLHREFWAGNPNEKWLTDVTEFKWYEGPIIHKLYLSAILDLCDRRIVSYVIRDRNDNKLVFDTLDKAVLENPNAHPLFHSDRGFQYTSRTFHKKLLDAGMTQSMSRVGRCIDNGPMEGFWGILKRECYYGHTFTSREQLISTIENYIDLLQQPPLPAQTVHPDSHAGSCQCHESGSLTGWLYKKFAVPLVKRRIKSYIIFIVYLTECASFFASAPFCLPRSRLSWLQNCIFLEDNSEMKIQIFPTLNIKKKNAQLCSQNKEKSLNSKIKSRKSTIFQVNSFKSEMHS